MYFLLTPLTLEEGNYPPNVTIGNRKEEACWYELRHIMYVQLA